MTSFPYQGRFEIHRGLPEHGTPRGEILETLRTMATEEDATWESGKCSGTMYCGDHDHYGFMNEAFGLFAHVNVLQRDMCPSATKFEAEIIAMTLDLLHADAIADGEPVGLVATGGTGSICHAMLAYREYGAQQRDISRPNVIKPETAHPAFDKACHLFGIDLQVAPGRPGDYPGRHRVGRPAHRREHRGHRGIGVQLRLRHHRPDRRAVRGGAANTGSGSTSTAASAGSSFPSARSWDTTSRCSTTAIRG